MKRSTLSEIARLAGVNPSTVSRALNPATASLVSGDRREKIIALCNKHNYRPQRTARGCATGRNYTIGYVSGALAKDMNSPFISLYLAGIAGELQSRGYSLLLLSAENLPGGLREGVRDILLSNIADGYIISAGMLREQAEEIYRCTGRPVLTLGYHNFRRPGKFPFVEITIEQAVAEVWQLIAGNMPGAKCCFFGKPSVSSRAKLGKIRRLAPPGAKVAEFSIPDPIHYSLMDYQQSFRSAEEQWNALSRFDVIWCGSDLVASGLCDVMRRHGAEPGREIMVIGYDHLAAVVPGSCPGLATIDPCWEEVGKLSARKILDFAAAPAGERSSEQVAARFVPGATLPFSMKKTVREHSAG